MEYNVPFMADIRVADVGEHRVALSGPAFIHAENQPRTGLLRDVAADSSVHIRNGPYGERAAFEYNRKYHFYF